MAFSLRRTVCSAVVSVALGLMWTTAKAGEPLEKLASLDGWQVLKEPFGQTVRIEGASWHALICAPDRIALETRLKLWTDNLGATHPNTPAEQPSFADILANDRTPTSQLKIQTTTNLMMIIIGRLKVGPAIFHETPFTADVLRELPGQNGSQIWARVKAGLSGQQVAAIRDAKSSVWLDAPGLRHGIQKEITSSSPRWQRFDEHFGIHDAAKAYRPHDDPIGPIDKAIDFTAGVCSNPEWPAARGIIDRLPALWN